MKTITLGAGRLKSTYSRDRVIRFLDRPRQEWEYMASGTGNTGVAVTAHDGIGLQINHEGALDEHGRLWPAGMLHVILRGDPLSEADAAGTFSMEHDIGKSVITVAAASAALAEIRADVERDIIFADIRSKRGTYVWFELSWAAKTRVSPSGDTVFIWHDNGIETDWHAINMASGMKDDSAFTDPLAGRHFGMAIHAPGMSVEGNRLEFPAEGRDIGLVIAAGAAMSEEALLGELGRRIAAAAADGRAERVRKHEAFWRHFWDRVWFETDDETMLCHMTAYDLYRYFCRVAAGPRREFPARFQLDILRSGAYDHCWLTMQIHSNQTIEAYYGCMRNGERECLESFMRDYERKFAFYKQFSSDYYGHPGMIIPYETNPWGSSHCDRPGVKPPPGAHIAAGKVLYHQDDHKWQMYSFEHGVTLMQFFASASRALGDPRIAEDVVMLYSGELIEFFLQHYRTDERGYISFDPTTSGETWYDVRNPASWIFLFEAFLPDLAEMARRGGRADIADKASRLLALLPPAPRGRWSCADDRSIAQILPAEAGADDVFLPAEEFDRHHPINFENPELYGVWPYGLQRPGMKDHDIALRTFESRIWKNKRAGWPLDVIWAACLGLTEQVLSDYESIHFPATVRCPGGFSFEEAPVIPQERALPQIPSMQGMGASVCHIYEMLICEQDEKLIILPAWPAGVRVRAAVYSPLAGRVEIEYEPGAGAQEGTVVVTAERPCEAATFLRGVKTVIK